MCWQLRDADVSRWEAHHRLIFHNDQAFQQLQSIDPCQSLWSQCPVNTISARVGLAAPLKAAQASEDAQGSFVLPVDLLRSHLQLGSVIQCVHHINTLAELAPRWKSRPKDTQSLLQAAPHLTSHSVQIPFLGTGLPRYRKGVTRSG